MSKAAVLELCSKVYKAQRDYLQTRLKERIPEGIELCHVEIFNELRKTPGIGINELAKRCGRVKSTVSVMCCSTAGVLANSRQLPQWSVI